MYICGDSSTIETIFAPVSTDINVRCHAIENNNNPKHRILYESIDVLDTTFIEMKPELSNIRIGISI